MSTIPWGIAHNETEYIMAQSDIREELNSALVEPLLPIGRIIDSIGALVMPLPEPNSFR